MAVCCVFDIHCSFSFKSSTGSRRRKVIWVYWNSRAQLALPGPLQRSGARTEFPHHSLLRTSKRFLIGSLFQSHFWCVGGACFKAVSRLRELLLLDRIISGYCLLWFILLNWSPHRHLYSLSKYNIRGLQAVIPRWPSWLSAQLGHRTLGVRIAWGYFVLYWKNSSLKSNH